MPAAGSALLSSSSRTMQRVGRLARLKPPRREAKTPPIVERCYQITHAAEAAGVYDLTDGDFRPTDTTLEQGIRRQHCYLLDQVGCTRPGFRLLEIGCGYGGLLKLARARGAHAVGVDVSQQPVDCGAAQGLRIFRCHYRDLLRADDWRGQFDGVVVNGVLEHWVQPEDVLAGRMDAIYRESFEIAHQMLDPETPNARYVTTAIHARRPIDPVDLLTPWRRHPMGSERQRLSQLHQWLGGYYPADGQLQTCAEPLFTLAVEQEGTDGYRIANELRRARITRGLYTRPKLLCRVARQLRRSPEATLTALRAYLFDRSWDWQFQGDDPPMKLLRHTWRAVRDPL